jgi:hypothetical protein
MKKIEKMFRMNNYFFTHFLNPIGTNRRITRNDRETQKEMREKINHRGGSNITDSETKSIIRGNGWPVCETAVFVERKSQ